MKLSAIKSALAQGKRVYWSDESYTVVKHKIFEDHYLVRDTNTGNCFPLEFNGRLQGKELDYFVK